MSVGPVEGNSEAFDAVRVVVEEIVENQIVMQQRRIGEDVKNEIIAEEASSSS